MKREHQFKDHGFPEVRKPNAERHRHLEFMHRVRIEKPQRKLDFMGSMCCIPALDWAVIKVRFPELICPDPQIQKLAWAIFMAHPVSEPYRTKERVRTVGSS